jgi:hypothetical protein
MRLLRILLLSLAASCASATQDENLLLSVLPVPLWDDGAVATATVSVVDRFGQPGTGHVWLQSSAGSLVKGITLTLDPLGTATAQLNCIAVEDPSCTGSITVAATWVDGTTHPAAARTVDIHTTDAYVSACAFSNRRALDVVSTQQPLLKLALLDSPPETSAIGASGIGVYDLPSNSGGLALSIPTVGADVTAEEQRVRAMLGPSLNPLVQTFTTWDGYPGARSTFDLESGSTLKEQLDTAAQTWAQLPSGLQASPVRGPFKGELTVVLHDKQQTGVVLALASTAGFSDAVSFRLDDLAGGSALGLSTDAPEDNCETFTVDGEGRKVDFVWVVDDSGSMASSQLAVATVGNTAATRIQMSAVDFRAAGVSTGDYPTDFAGSFRDWTVDTEKMLGWFAGPNSWGTSGSGTEEGFAGLRAFIEGTAKHGDAPVPGPFRDDSEVHVIFLSDTDDQSLWSPQNMYDYLRARFPRRHIVAHGIVCPEDGQTCGDTAVTAPGKYHTLVRQTGGVLANIRIFNPPMVTPDLAAQQAAAIAAIARSVVNGAGFQLRRRAITASVRVATSATVGECNNADIPRDVENGWDLDPITGKVSFNGACVPQAGSIAVISYQSWARNGTQVHNQGSNIFGVLAPEPPDAGDADAGASDAGTSDAGCDGGTC